VDVLLGWLGDLLGDVLEGGPSVVCMVSMGCVVLVCVLVELAILGDSWGLWGVEVRGGVGVCVGGHWGP
jgi:hypothetical protein